MLTKVCHRAGFYVHAINDYESRVRGGHNFFQLCISSEKVLAPSHQVQLMVDLDGVTWQQHHLELSEDALVLCEERYLSQAQGNRQPVAFSQLASQAGAKTAQNSVAAACLALLGATLETVKAEVSRYFQEKPEETNSQAAQLGYESVAQLQRSWALDWQGEQPKGALLDGATALALGAAAADCRIGAFYPMSPATGIMNQLVALSGELPLVVEQAEDELAAANMVIGAFYAGCRALTATSGGGFCLMSEALGLAGITETPMVIINAQRPGAATGLPTRTGQGDLLFMLHASQDEFPRFVFAPGTLEQAYAAQGLGPADVLLVSGIGQAGKPPIFCNATFFTACMAGPCPLPPALKWPIRKCRWW